MAKNKGITVEQLCNECLKLIKSGKGKRHIMISGDDEGNSYHELFFGFSNVSSVIGDMDELLPYGVQQKEANREYIVLG